MPRGPGPPFVKATRGCGSAHTGPAQGELQRRAASLSPFFSPYPSPRPHPLKIPVASVIKCLIPSPTLSGRWCIIRSGKACFQANRPNKCYYWDSASPGCTIVTRALANLVEENDQLHRVCVSERGACISPPHAASLSHQLKKAPCDNSPNRRGKNPACRQTTSCALIVQPSGFKETGSIYPRPPPNTHTLKRTLQSGLWM